MRDSFPTSFLSPSLPVYSSPFISLALAKPSSSRSRPFAPHSFMLFYLSPSLAPLSGVVSVFPNLWLSFPLYHLISRDRYEFLSKILSHPSAFAPSLSICLHSLPLSCALSFSLFLCLSPFELLSFSLVFLSRPLLLILLFSKSLSFSLFLLPSRVFTLSSSLSPSLSFFFLFRYFLSLLFSVFAISRLSFLSKFFFRTPPFSIAFTLSLCHSPHSLNQSLFSLCSFSSAFVSSLLFFPQSLLLLYCLPTSPLLPSLPSLFFPPISLSHSFGLF